MTRDNLDRVVELFERALELPESEREALLAASGAEPGVVARVRAMLRADAKSSPMLDATPDHLAAAMAVESPTYEGRRIGPYTIRSVLGRGGMGVVCLAEREDVGKQVALKLVAGGLASPERIRRFLVERRVLAQLEHPNIATLLDAGVMEDGTPWLAMEYVPGQTIDAYCADRHLSAEQRLALFQRICDAVGYAHRHLVVHRDIKPSNILIGEDGEPRLLDFGIAKLLAAGEDGTETGTGPGLMTPQYAAPEQIRGDPITTATDVYQLGALLFEILTGQPPRARRTAATSPDLGPLPAPSSVAPAQGPIAASRLRGDLDTIVLKATDPEPARRYSGVEQLRDDVGRHLAGLPIVARPAAASYRLGKFIRRHRGGTAVATVATLAGLAVAIAFGEEARRTAAERVRAEQVSSLLTEIFAGADPTVAQGDTITVRGVLDRGAEKIRGNLTLDPAVKARLLSVIAGAYSNLGRVARSVELQSEAVALLERAVPRDHPDRLNALRRLGRWMVETGARERSFGPVDTALAIARTLGRDRQEELADALNEVGYTRQFVGDYAAARPAYEEALQIYRALKSTADAASSNLVNLGVLAENRGDFAASKAYFQEALDRRRATLGPNHSATARVMLNLANTLVRAGERDQAETLVRDAVAIQRRVFAGPHPEVVNGLDALARILAQGGKLAEAEAVERDALAMARRLAGAGGGDWSGVATVIANLAGYVQGSGRLDEAAVLHDEAVRAFTTLVGERHLSTAVSLSNLAWTERLRNRLAESEALYRRAVPVLDSVWRGSPRLSPTLVDFGIVLSLRGRCEEAEPVLRRAVAMASKAWPRTNGDVIRAKAFLGTCLTTLSRFAAAESLLVDAHQSLLDGVGPTNQYTAVAVRNLVALYQKWGRPAEAARYRPDSGSTARQPASRPE